MQVHTVFGSITDYTKGTIELVSGETRATTCFPTCSRSRQVETL